MQSSFCEETAMSNSEVNINEIKICRDLKLTASCWDY